LLDAVAGAQHPGLSFAAKVARLSSELVLLPPREFGSPPRGRLLTWAECADVLRLQGFAACNLTADRVRSKEFHTEKKRRLAVLRHWRAHFEAFHAAP
jgi:hypothetical protein